MENASFSAGLTCVIKMFGYHKSHYFESINCGKTGTRYTLTTDIKDFPRKKREYSGQRRSRFSCPPFSMPKWYVQYFCLDRAI